MTRLKAKAEFSLHKMGYQPYKNGNLWKKTFGFSLIVAKFTTDKIVFRGYSNSNGETFSYKAVATLIADFMPVKDVREEIAHAECNLGIDCTTSCQYVDWGYYDPEELDIYELSLIKGLEKEKTK